MTATYEASTRHLRKSYEEAVGYALEYGIKTYVPGTGLPSDLGPWPKAMGTLREEIRAHEREHGITDGMYPQSPPSSRAPERKVQARCGNGHLARWGSSPFMVTPNRGPVQVWGSPMICSCGSQYRS